MAAAAIEAQALTRRFGDVEAVAGIDLDVGEGEVFAFLGPNGAGKTTTVRILVTLLRPTSGSARVAGHDVVTESAAVRRSIGVTLQELALDPMMTATELMSLNLSLYGLSRDRAAVERGRRLLTELGLDEAAGRRVMTYSGGMRRRLDLALALVHEPKVLFLDEPTTGLDPGSRHTIWDRVRELGTAGTTVFLTTQYLEEADQLAGRVSIIDRGRVVAEGAPEQLKAEVGEPRLELALTGTPTRDVAEVLAPFGRVAAAGPASASLVLPRGSFDLSGLVRALDEAGVEVRSFDLVRPTLEDVFIAKTGRVLEGASRPAGPAAQGMSVIARG
jgi:ABC-2 type transport system ATP-binding protein